MKELYGCFCDLFWAYSIVVMYANIVYIERALTSL